jgi:hypothetical protein
MSIQALDVYLRDITKEPLKLEKQTESAYGMTETERMLEALKNQMTKSDLKPTLSQLPSSLFFYFSNQLKVFDKKT